MSVLQQELEAKVDGAPAAVDPQVARRRAIRKGARWVVGGGKGPQHAGLGWVCLPAFAGGAVLGAGVCAGRQTRAADMLSGCACLSKPLAAGPLYGPLW